MGIFKPPYGARLNLGHPLARGLVFCCLMNESGGSWTYDLVHKTKGAFINSPVWISEGVDFEVDNSERIDFLSPKELNLGTSNYTVASKAKIEGSVVGNKGIVCFDSYTPAYYINDNNLRIYDSGDKTISTVDLVIDADYSFAWVRSGTGANQTKYYVNGNSAGTTTHADTIPNPTAVSIATLDAQATFGNFDGIIYYVYIYNRDLTPQEIQALHINPYAFIEDPYPIELFGYVPAEVGWTGIINGVTNPAKINGIPVANIKKVMRI
jgi:hypothetical protein